MSLHNNSDYEIISNAEVSNVISKYSPDMIDISLEEILRRKNVPSISPMANMIVSYENNLKIDMAKYPQYQNDMLERRTELYSHIMNRICEVHGLSYQLPANADIYTCANLVYQFLISGYYQSCISFFANFLKREAKSISAMITNKPKDDLSTTEVYVNKVYMGNDDLVFIHTHMSEVLDAIHSIDIPLESIIQTSWAASPMASVSGLLSSILIEDDRFYNLYLNTIDRYRAEVVTDIRLQLMPRPSSIKEFIQED